MNRQDHDAPRDDLGAGPEAGPAAGLDALAGAIDRVAADLEGTPRPAAAPWRAALDPVPAPPRARRETYAALWAAALVAAVLSYPSYVGWTTLRGTAAASVPPQAQASPPQVQWLSPPRDGARSAAQSADAVAAETVTVAPDEALLLMVEIPFENRDALAGGLDYNLSDDTGRRILAGHVGSERLGRYLTELEALPLHLHGHDMPAGLYRLSLTVPGSDQGAELELALRVERP